MTSDKTILDLRRIVRLVGLLNFAYFGIEFAMARSIGSVSLFADSIDFLEDTAVNFLIVAALGWSARSDALANVAILLAALVTAHTLSAWPD